MADHDQTTDLTPCEGQSPPAEDGPNNRCKSGDGGQQTTDQRRIDAATRLIEMLTYNGTERGYARGSRIWGNELFEAATAWTFLYGEEVDLSWVVIDE